MCSKLFVEFTKQRFGKSTWGSRRKVNGEPACYGVYEYEKVYRTMDDGNEVDPTSGAQQDQ